MYVRWFQPHGASGVLPVHVPLACRPFTAVRVHAAGPQYPGLNPMSTAPVCVWSSFNNKSALELMLVVESAYGNGLGMVVSWLGACYASKR
jgi:hypothetical protein